MQILNLSLAILAATAMLEAAPITYNVNVSIPTSFATPITITGSITTNGTLGQIQTSDITSFSLIQTYNSNPISFATSVAPPSNPIVLGYFDPNVTSPGPLGVVATATTLTLYRNSVFQIGGSPDVAIGLRIIAGVPASNPNSQGEGRANFGEFGVFSFLTSVPLELGTAPASTGGEVPEPSTLCLMGASLGAAWVARKRQDARR